MTRAYIVLLMRPMNAIQAEIVKLAGEISVKNRIFVGTSVGPRYCAIYGHVVLPFKFFLGRGRACVLSPKLRNCHPRSHADNENRTFAGLENFPYLPIFGITHAIRPRTNNRQSQLKMAIVQTPFRYPKEAFYQILSHQDAPKGSYAGMFLIFIKVIHSSVGRGEMRQRGEMRRF